MLGVKPERALCTPTRGYVFVAQLRNDLPKAIGNLLWFAYGPANTSCSEILLTAYASDCANHVGFAYSELVDYLLLRHLVGDPEFAHPTPPRIAAPTVPDRE